ncbi:MAG: Rpn family recombination-promoting nuclease/putative transposase [Polyangiaceae bacterium]|nr:Rpn family recombination-promoting nuclease/putative transposase [Polyangiaceae bacterium]
MPLKSGAGTAFVYVLFEHQSSDDPLMVFRMLAYMVRVWEHYAREHEGVRELPLIVPVVLHHDEGRWQSATSFHQLFPSMLVGQPVWAGLVPSFRFLLDDVAVASDEELQARQMSAFARLALWALRDARFDRLEQTLAAWLDLFSRLLQAPGGEQAVQTIFCYIYEVRGTATANALAEKTPTRFSVRQP